ncbi:MAG: hypothetical protein ACFFD8_04990 [Candidatus Thorarchaeota archaeon]
MQKKPPSCNTLQTCLKQYGPQRLTFLIGDDPNFQGCECNKCPQQRMSQIPDFHQIFWFYWPYDGIFNQRKTAKDRKADWEPLFVVYHPETSHFFLVTTAHWQYVCWGPWNEYKLRFLNFWHTPLIEGTLREKIQQRLEKIYETLTGFGKVCFGVVNFLEKLSFFSRRIMRTKTQSVGFTPSSCLSVIPNLNPRRDPVDPSSSLETRQKDIDWKKVENAVKTFRTLMQFPKKEA